MKRVSVGFTNSTSFLISAITPSTISLFTSNFMLSVIADVNLFATFFVLAISFAIPWITAFKSKQRVPTLEGMLVLFDVEP